MVLRQMKYFVKITESGSFSAAAEELYVSQSAISQQIIALEEELGIKLLKREKRSFSLTPAGEYFYRRCKSILDQIDSAVHETIRIGSDDENLLRIGCLNLYSGAALRNTILSFSSLYPHVDQSVISGNHEELYRRLLQGELDMVLNDQRRAFSDEFENFELAIAHVYVDLPSSFSLGEKEYVNVEALKNLPCILISSRESHATDEPFYRDIIGFTGSYLFAESAEEARLLVAGRRGFLPVECVGKPFPSPTGVNRIPLYRGDKPLRHRFCAFWLKERGGYYIEEFAQMLEDEIIRESGEDSLLS